MRKISEKGKLKNCYGTGEGACYKPYIEAREFNSLGTCTTLRDWKTGRTVELLSQGEMMVWYILRWNDNNLDIREQYPLVLKKTIDIADEFGIIHPHDRKTRMTTDFYITQADGQCKAISVKDSFEAIKDMRSIQKLFLEKKYWEREQVPYKIVLKTDVNCILAHNIRLVVQYYDAETVHDDISVIKHLIARKKIKVDMETKSLDFEHLVTIYGLEVKKWKASK